MSYLYATAWRLHSRDIFGRGFSFMNQTIKSSDSFFTGVSNSTSNLLRCSTIKVIRYCAWATAGNQVLCCVGHSAGFSCALWATTKDFFPQYLGHQRRIWFSLLGHNAEPISSFKSDPNQILIGFMWSTCAWSHICAHVAVHQGSTQNLHNPNVPLPSPPPFL